MLLEQKIVDMQSLIANKFEPEEKSTYYVRVKTMDDVVRYHQKIGIAGTVASELIKLQ